MSYENITYEKKENIAIITVNRPKVLNALNRQTINELDQAVIEAECDPDVKVVVITGSGDRAFIAGADINEFVGIDVVTAKTLSKRFQDFLDRLENLSKPVIAAINGLALGGGCELAMACDLRIAATTARLGQPEINLGIIPGAGGTQRLPRLVGVAKAKELIYTGDMITAEEAEKIGLVNRVVPPEKLMDETIALAKKISQKSPFILQLAKEAINVGINLDMRSAISLENDLVTIAFTTEDKEEGMRAFMEKRKPEFKGK
jgi:enoyl-CoA hydratase